MTGPTTYPSIIEELRKEIADTRIQATREAAGLRLRIAKLEMERRPFSIRCPGAGCALAAGHVGACAPEREET